MIIGVVIYYIIIFILFGLIGQEIGVSDPTGITSDSDLSSISFWQGIGITFENLPLMAEIVFVYLPLAILAVAIIPLI